MGRSRRTVSTGRLSKLSRHTALIDVVLTFMVDIGDSYTLTIDP